MFSRAFEVQVAASTNCGCNKSAIMARHPQIADRDVFFGQPRPSSLRCLGKRAGVISLFPVMPPSPSYDQSVLCPASMRMKRQLPVAVESLCNTAALKDAQWE